jgi:hypothetical protein
MKMVGRRLRALGVLGLVVSLSAAGSALGQDQKKPAPERKLGKDERVDLDALIAAVDATAAGQPAPTGLSAAWVQSHFMKAQDLKTYVPFTMSIDPATLSGQPVAMYVRVVSKAAPPPPAPPAEGAKPAPPARVEYPFENIHFLGALSGTPGQPIYLSRAINVTGGADYDVYIAVRERAARNAQPKMTVVRQSISVPNFWTDELDTSSLLLTSRAETVNTPLNEEQQAENPYTLGTVRLAPSLDMKFSKANDLNIIFWVYNPGLDAAKKPDVTIEYAFHQKIGDAEKYFNRTRPQKLDAQTLPPEFDLAAGHQLPGGQTIPLASFPEGDYRLEIKVTDNLSKKTLTRDVRFNVGA